MTQQNSNPLFFNREINVKNVMEIAELQLKFKQTAKEDGDVELANFYDKKAKAFNELAAALVTGGLMTLPQILGLPSIRLLSLPIDSEMINLEIQESKELKEIKGYVGNDEYKEIVRAKIKSPKVKKEVQEYKDNIADTAERLQFEGFDLMGLNKQKELALVLKAKYERELNAEEEKQLFAKNVRETVINYLQSGARMQAADLLKNYLFRDKDYPDYEIHRLLDSLKSKYKINEPKSNPRIKALYIDNFKSKWLKITYKYIKVKGQTKDPAVTTDFGLFNPDKYEGIIGIDGKVLCSVDDVERFIPVTEADMQQIEAAMKEL